MRVKYLAQEHNAVPRPGLEPGPLDPESSALTIRPPRLPRLYTVWFFISSDANECVNDKICSGQPCINIVGSYRCACGKGYMTKQDKECEGKEQSFD